MMNNNQYIFFKEEKWIDRELLNISNEFFKKIEKNNIKLIESKGSIIKFIYVGIITFKNEVIIIVPKYFDPQFYSELECMLKLMKIFKKIPKSIIKNNEKEILLLNNENNYSEIAICDYLIKDYLENDYYIRTSISKKLNDNGMVDWKKTINELNPIFSNGYPIYDNCYYTHKRNNENYFITKVHQAVIEYSLAKYASILGYKLGRFNYNQAQKKLNQQGKTDKIVNELQRELEFTFSDRNINLLKTLITFFKKRHSNGDNNLSLYGTTNFKLIWEHLCGTVFSNQYYMLSEQISPILWRNLKGKAFKNDLNALKPDVLREFNGNMLILDAKYYSIRLNNNSIIGNPGSYDIVKQLTYALAFNNKGYNIINCLLYPKETGELFNIFGTVNLEFFNQRPIINIYVSPMKIMERYLYNNYLSHEELEEFVNRNLDFIAGI